MGIHVVVVVFAHDRYWKALAGSARQSSQQRTRFPVSIVYDRSTIHDLKHAGFLDGQFESEDASNYDAAAVQSVLHRSGVHNRACGIVLLHIEEEHLQELQPRSAALRSLRRYYHTVYNQQVSMIRATVEAAAPLTPMVVHVCQAYQGLSLSFFAACVSTSSVAVLDSLVPEAGITVRNLLQQWRQRRAVVHPLSYNQKIVWFESPLLHVCRRLVGSQNSDLVSLFGEGPCKHKACY